VYLLYPPGYSGSYVNWAINISDQHRRSKTVPDPVNKDQSRKLGGIGTAHVHQRIPTHQNYWQHLAWVVHNRPTDPEVYIINQHNTDLEHNICHIMCCDPTAVVIRIHDNNDTKIRAYGAINMITKWPTFMAAYKKWADHDLDFDPFDCEQDLAFRNYTALKTWCHGSPVDISALDLCIKRHQDWFDVRHQNQPHEILHQHYESRIDYTNRLFEISCVDIARPEFVDTFKLILDASQLSNDYSSDYLESFHHNYIEQQKNLQWFDSFDHWTQTGQLDDYLMSHSGIQAHIIKEIFTQCFFTNGSWPHQDHWPCYYQAVRDPSWPDCDHIDNIHKLPQRIQDELMVEAKGYLSQNWRQMSLTDINHLYQTQILGRKA
jgi:hypothetical protein